MLLEIYVGLLQALPRKHKSLGPILNVVCSPQKEWKSKSRPLKLCSCMWGKLQPMCSSHDKTAQNWTEPSKSQLPEYENAKSVCLQLSHVLQLCKPLVK